MAKPALKFEEEYFVEERIAILETKFENLQSDVTEMKGDIKDLRKDVTGLKIDVERGFAAVNASIAALALSTEKSFGKLNVSRILDRVWSLLMSAALLGIIAKALHWI